MKIMLLAEVKKATKTDCDFQHSNIFWKFKNPKFSETKYDFHIDRIDNDYTGNKAPYFACVYFGSYSQSCIITSEEHLEHDTDVIYATENYIQENNENYAKIIPQGLDMWQLEELFLEYHLACNFIHLCETFGVKFVENNHKVYEHRVTNFTYEKAKKMLADCEKHEYFKFL